MIFVLKGMEFAFKRILSHQDTSQFIIKLVIKVDLISKNEGMEVRFTTQDIPPNDNKPHVYVFRGSKAGQALHTLELLIQKNTRRKVPVKDSDLFSLYFDGNLKSPNELLPEHRDNFGIEADLEEEHEDEEEEAKKKSSEPKEEESTNDQKEQTPAEPESEEPLSEPKNNDLDEVTYFFGEDGVGVFPRATRERSNSEMKEMKEEEIAYESHEIGIELVEDEEESIKTVTKEEATKKSEKSFKEKDHTPYQNDKCTVS